MEIKESFKMVLAIMAKIPGKCFGSLFFENTSYTGFLIVKRLLSKVRDIGKCTLSKCKFTNCFLQQI